MKARDLRDFTDEEIQQRLRERADALKTFCLQLATSVIDNVRGARVARRDIARIKTILREREQARTQGAK